MFVDDLVLLAKATMTNTKTIIDIFNVLSAKPGQHINFNKSKLLLSASVDSTLSQALSTALNLNIPLIATNFGKYLGLPITTNNPKTSDYQYIIDRVTYKLSKWKS